MATRRAMLAGAAATLGLAGCLGEESAPTDQPADSDEIEETAPRGPVRIAHWAWADADEDFRSMIDAVLPDSFELTVETAPDRRNHESAVADAMTSARPPETFQTVTGAELERYVTAVTLHAIPDIVTIGSDNRYRPGVANTVVVDDDPYAVPVTVDCRNWLAVDDSSRREAGLATTDIGEGQDSAAAVKSFGAPTEGARLAMPDTKTAWFQLFCNELMATAGPTGFEEIHEREPLIATIEPAVQGLVTLLDEDRLLLAETWENAAAAVGDGRAIAVLGSRSIADALTSLDVTWSPVVWPGTGGVVSIDVAGFPFPKRAVNAHGTAALLEALDSASVQSTVARLAGSIPARADVDLSDGNQVQQKHAAWLDDAATVVSSPATGCGLDPDARRRVLEQFVAESLDQTPTDEFVRRVQAALQ